MPPPRDIGPTRGGAHAGPDDAFAGAVGARREAAALARHKFRPLGVPTAYLPARSAPNATPASPP